MGAAAGGGGEGEGAVGGGEGAGEGAGAGVVGEGGGEGLGAGEAMGGGEGLGAEGGVAEIVVGGGEGRGCAGEGRGEGAGAGAARGGEGVSGAGGPASVAACCRPAACEGEQRPQVARQKPPSSIQLSLHLPQACGQQEGWCECGVEVHITDTVTWVAWSQAKQMRYAMRHLDFRCTSHSNSLPPNPTQPLACCWAQL